MNKIKCLSILFILFLLVGCSNEEDIKASLKSDANDYYNKYILNKVNNLDELELTLSDLKDGGINNKLLKNCKNDTKVTIFIENKEITGYEYYINCK